MQLVDFIQKSWEIKELEQKERRFESIDHEWFKNSMTSNTPKESLQTPLLCEGT